MLNSGHPDDERLSSLAAREADAVDDTALAAHVGGCSRCAGLVTDLAMLRSALAEMPDLAPQRPLRLLPPAQDERAATDSIGLWVRRLFAPVLTAGAALAMVGMVGTALPAMQQGASGAAPDAVREAEAASGAPGADAGAAEMRTFATEEAADGSTGEGGGTTLQAPPSDERTGAAGDTLLEDGTPLPAERSPWPMVLFTGVALMIGAGLLRWILAPRAGG